MKLFSIVTLRVIGPKPYQLMWIAAVAWEGWRWRIGGRWSCGS